MEDLLSYIRDWTAKNEYDRKVTTPWLVTVESKTKHLMLYNLWEELPAKLLTAFAKTPFADKGIKESSKQLNKIRAKFWEVQELFDPFLNHEWIYETKWID